MGKHIAISTLVPHSDIFELRHKVDTHTSDSLAVWGYLAYRIRKPWMWMLAAVIVLLIGILHMY